MLFAIVWGTGNYTLKNLTPSDLGLNPIEFQKYSFQVVQSYFHLFWIPLLPTGVNYVVKKQGLKEKYHAPADIKQMMKEHKIPFWHHLGSLAIPILLIIGLIGFNANESLERRRSKQYAEKMQKQMQKIASDTATYKPFALKSNDMFNLIEQNFTEKKEALQKIDTNGYSILPLYLETRKPLKDTITEFNTENTLVYSNNFRNFINTKEDFYTDERIAEFCSEQSLNKNIIDWYHHNMRGKDISNVYPDDLNRTNEKIKKIKYLAIMKFTGYVSPKINSEVISKLSNRNRADKDATPAYESGFATAKVYLYDVEAKTLKEQFKVLAENSRTISTMTVNGSTSASSLKSQLDYDLQRNLQKEIQYALRIDKRKDIEMEGITE